MIQRMPDIWDDQIFHTSRTSVFGELANWAVRQSPYLIPDKLPEALREFVVAFSETEDHFGTSCKALLSSVRAAFEKCPAILAWNKPKKGNYPTLFVSRHARPAPDDDFIDLDALARNIAHSITLSEKYSKAHDDKIDT